MHEEGKLSEAIRVRDAKRSQVCSLMQAFFSSDKPYLTLAKFVTGAVILALLISRGTEPTFPLVHLDMFLGSWKPFDTTAVRDLLIVTDTGGAAHPVYLVDLHAGASDRTRNFVQSIVRRAFDSERSVADNDLYRAYLLTLLSDTLPGVDVARVDFWQEHWNIDPADPFGNFDPQQPDSRRRVAGFDAAVYGQPDAPPDRDPDLRFGDAFDLLAFVLPEGAAVQPCASLPLRTWWRMTRTVPNDIHITAVLADSAGVGRARSDDQLAGAHAVFLSAGAELLDRRRINIPCDLPPGDYSLLVGLYEPETVVNLTITYPDGAPYGTLAYLTTVMINAAD